MVGLLGSLLGCRLVELLLGERVLGRVHSTLDAGVAARARLCARGSPIGSLAHQARNFFGDLVPLDCKLALPLEVLLIYRGLDRALESPALEAEETDFERVLGGRVRAGPDDDLADGLRELSVFQWEAGGRRLEVLEDPGPRPTQRCRREVVVEQPSKVVAPSFTARNAHREED